MTRPNRLRRSVRMAIPVCALLIVAAKTAPAQHGSLIAVSNEAGHTITLIDAKSLKVLRTVPVPQRPRGIEFSPDGKRIFVALSDPQKNVQTSGDAIVSIDVGSGRINGVFPAGSDPGVELFVERARTHRPEARPPTTRSRDRADRAHAAPVAHP